ncbi:MAG: rod shape-determining protein MreC [Paludibacteraceae bacterium]|nr:rod shape-determining protein MreC [Paludibacteraceae bacterium]
MRNLLQFLLKYSHVILFLILEGVAIAMLISNSAYPRSVYATSANRLSGEFYSWNNSVLQYFSLRSENLELVKENAMLRGQLAQLGNIAESVAENDTAVLNHYCYSHLGLRYIPARVVQVEAGKRHNCFTINKGTRDGVETDMGVVGSAGVVGIVSATTERFSLVMPLINEQMMLSCRLQSGVYGPLEWDGEKPQFAYLRNIARHANVLPGDTVTTSGLTTAFPEGILVGVVEKAELKETDAYYNITVRLATDFTKPRYVQVISNEALREQQQLMDY